jgi:c-di-GMP-binding flagellar brake protein YcgR
VLAQFFLTSGGEIIVLKRFSYWLFDRSSAVKTPQAAAQAWTSEEAELILWNEQHRALGQIELPGRSGLFHSALLGVDIQENQLLLDVPFPSPPIDIVSPAAQCTISFFKLQQLLQLRVRVEQRLIYQGKPALLVKIEERSFHYDRRFTNRVSFSRNENPLMRLQIPMAEQLRASVLNLSSGGALLNIFGKLDEVVQKKSLLSAKLQLDEGCCIDVKCEVKTVTYYRRPCQHTQFRVQFLAMSDQDKRKLDLFIAYKQDSNLKELRLKTLLDVG